MRERKKNLFFYIIASWHRFAALNEYVLIKYIYQDVSLRFSALVKFYSCF